MRSNSFLSNERWLMLICDNSLESAVPALTTKLTKFLWTRIDLLASSYDNNDVVVTQLTVGALRHPYDVSFATSTSGVQRVIR